MEHRKSILNTKSWIKWASALLLFVLVVIVGLAAATVISVEKYLLSMRQDSPTPQISFAAPKSILNSPTQIRKPTSDNKSLQIEASPNVEDPIQGEKNTDILAIDRLQNLDRNQFMEVVNNMAIHDPDLSGFAQTIFLAPPDKKLEYYRWINESNLSMSVKQDVLKVGLLNYQHMVLAVGDDGNYKMTTNRERSLQILNKMVDESNKANAPDIVMGQAAEAIKLTPDAELQTYLLQELERQHPGFTKFYFDLDRS